jgi:hypothetical protein
MKELIHKINPPGLLKPNQGAIFATIGTVFEQVKGIRKKPLMPIFRI